MSKKGGRKNKKVTKLIIGEEEINNVDDLLTTYVEEKKGVKPKESSDIYVPNFANHQERPQRQPRAEGEKKEDDGLWTVRHGHDFKRRPPKKDREEDREPQPSEADTADSWRRKDGEAFVPRKGGDATERNQREYGTREPRQPAGPSEADTADSWRRKDSDVPIPKKTYERRHENTEKPHRDFGERRNDDRGKRTFGPKDGQHQNTKKSTQHIKQGKKTSKQSSKPVVDEEGWMTQ
ncbi:hypothetical protein ENU1_050680 [Entamoeba nuttalli P19]|uniref:Uncharacterized protein n=1 Tax=Entamoeba nuttalli (strain P19) TaxID=1076696 RepID=K2H272_ENTNP|nr:hypothetical protein ENU1_050680 [Entamoeba nuttalli P19]EKE41588.1 hypothetical protein ENU1_050680 [Entamoeba nuttalli P19]|eukprot:XP_008856069.1 hypothetical protein ENU1_050680 [Entamoeba nuttalli P19]